MDIDDRISNLPDSVVCHILSRLPTKDAVRTSILSKDWENKWTWIYNIRLDDGKREPKAFLRFMDRTLLLTQDTRIQSFRLTCNRVFEHEETWTTAVLTRSATLENLEIIGPCCWSFCFVENICRFGSLTELKLVSNCTLYIPLMKDCFNNLKILSLGPEVILSNHDDESNNNNNNSGKKVVMNFPVLEELELTNCNWKGMKCVEINAPALRFMTLGHQLIWDFSEDDFGGGWWSSSYFYTLDNFVVNAPSLLSAHLKGGTKIGIQADVMLKGFPALEYLKLSSEVIKALTESTAYCRLPCFNRLKQLELCVFNNVSDEALVKLLQVMPFLESLSLYLKYTAESYYDRGDPDARYNGPESLPLPSGIGSRLKVVKLDGFGGVTGQINLVKSVLKNAMNLEKLIVSVCTKTLMRITPLFSTFPKSSTRASIVVVGPRDSK